MKKSFTFILLISLLVILISGCSKKRTYHYNTVLADDLIMYVDNKIVFDYNDPPKVSIGKSSVFHIKIILEDKIINNQKHTNRVRAWVKSPLDGTRRYALIYIVNDTAVFDFRDIDRGTMKYFNE